MVKKPRKPDPDRCEPQRGRLAQLDLEIGEDLDQLGSPDLTADQRRRIEAELGSVEIHLECMTAVAR